MRNREANDQADRILFLGEAPSPVPKRVRGLRTLRRAVVVIYDGKEH